MIWPFIWIGDEILTWLENNLTRRKARRAAQPQIELQNRRRVELDPYEAGVPVQRVNELMFEYDQLYLRKRRKRHAIKNTLKIGFVILAFTWLTVFRIF
jgi:hypothetical protein